MYKLLIVDDETDMQLILKKVMQKEGYFVITASSAEEGMSIITREAIDIVISDFKMSGMNGIEFIKEIKRFNDNIRIIIITAYGDVETAVDAMLCGAFNFILKPFNNNIVKAIVKKAADEIEILDQNKYLCEELEKENEFIGKSKEIIKILDTIDQVSSTPATVLITGESGTGKEMVARRIHYSSNQKKKNFVVVNCGALSENLLESELFGHVKGSFTGAVTDKKGIFEQADEGTIFLDEIGDTSLGMQVKLLRVLQSGEFMRVGDTISRKVNVRIISATNRNLKEMIEKESFRQDLYYRINVISIHIPPLRKREGDIEEFVKYFIKKYSKKINKNVTSVSKECMMMLKSHSWPGNVRELQNVIERAVIFSKGNEITVDTIIGEGIFKENRNRLETYDDLKKAKENVKNTIIEKLEQEFIFYALERYSGNVSNAAKNTGIDRANFQKMMRKYGISSTEFKEI